MKHSAASTTPQNHFPPFFAAVGHSTVSTANTKGTLSVDPSVARNTLRFSRRHWAQFFSGRPGPGFSPPAIVPNITRRVSRSLCVRCTPPAKRRRPLRIIVSTLSHCALLRALAYDMRWSVRCRRWKPMIRWKNCVVPFAAQRSAPCRGATLHTRSAGFPSLKDGKNERQRNNDVSIK